MSEDYFWPTVGWVGFIGLLVVSVLAYNHQAYETAAAACRTYGPEWRLEVQQHYKSASFVCADNEGNMRVVP